MAKIVIPIFDINKIFHIIIKKVDLEAVFLCFSTPRRLKYVFYYSKVKFFVIKLVSDLLYLVI